METRSRRMQSSTAIQWIVAWAEQIGSSHEHGADVLKSRSFVKKTTAEAAPVGDKVNQVQNDIDEVAPHGAPHVIAHASRTSRLTRVRRSLVPEGLQTL
jgi:hypothetical protein